MIIEFEKKPILFQHPCEVISCHDPFQLGDSFARIEEHLAAGRFAAGFLSYESGYALEERLVQKKKYDFPLLCMGIYSRPLPLPESYAKAAGAFQLDDFQTSEDQKDYSRDIQSIRDDISRGDVYQITYCIKMGFSFKGDALSLYRKLLREQPVPYPAYIEAEHFNILSLSPEMFLKKEGPFIATKPMKGTWPRGKNIFSDLLSGYRLHYDEKNRAENLMITDLLRNDLGRIGRRIRVPRLFEVARYKTLYQMTSTVTAEIEDSIALYPLFKALFPSGSVTGAPKIRAMEIIRGIEKEERRIYTGAIGYVTPDRKIFFNIPIRTLLISGEKGEMGIGGGIVWDSTPEGEWAEGMLKARFLSGQAVRK
jgi:para-aminobenzoate synthetase / 4-amino-4-deoxychorismate lyase